MSKKRNTPKKPKPAPRKRRFIGLICAAVLVAAVVAAFALTGSGNTFPKLTIDGHQVTQTEYNWAMYEARNDVLSQHSAAGISIVHWDEETALGLPSEMTAQQAVEILKEFYAVTTLAVERGYLTDASFAAMETEREEQNQQRAAAITAGEIVTGLTNFDLDQYISYRISGLQRQFCYDDTNPEMEVTDADIALRYEQDKDSYYAVADSYQLRWIEIYDHPELEEQVYQLYQTALESGSLSEAVEQYPDLAEYYQEEYFQGENYGSYERVYSYLLAYAEKLEAGEMTEVIGEEGSYLLMECVEHTEGGWTALESVATVVEQTIRAERYDELIAQRAEQMQAEYDVQALARYTAGQLG